MCIYIYTYKYIHLCSKQISTVLSSQKKKQVFAHISHDLMKQKYPAMKIQGRATDLFFVWSVLPSTQRIFIISYVRNCKNQQQNDFNDCFFFFSFLVGFKENLVWSLQIQIKGIHYASRGCELLKLHVHGTLESDPRQILFLLWFVSRTNRWAPWRLTFLYQRKLFLLLEASFKDWFQENEETRNPFPSLYFCQESNNIL